MRRRKSPKRRLRKFAMFMLLSAGLGMFHASRQEKASHPEETWPQAAEETLSKTVETAAEKTQQLTADKGQPEKSQKEEKKKTKSETAKASSSSDTKNTADWLPGLEKRQYRGKLAVVIDDCGYDMDALRTLTRLPVPMSFAIIPFKPRSRDALSEIKGQGRVAMLHLPMEPVSGSSSEPESVKVGMTKEQIQRFTQKAVDSLPGIQGVNNHQGSKATADGPTIAASLAVLKNNGLFFIDSRTNSATVAESKAKALGMRTGHNSLFLDNSTNEETIRQQIAKAIQLADRYGSVIVICHARPHTAAAWKKSVTAVKNSGIRMVSVTDLL